VVRFVSGLTCSILINDNLINGIERQSITLAIRIDSRCVMVDAVDADRLSYRAVHGNIFTASHQVIMQYRIDYKYLSILSLKCD